MNIIDDEEIDFDDEQIFTYSNENYKNETIFEENISTNNFPLEKTYDNLSLFEKKHRAIELFYQMEKNKNINIEEILKLDNTNKIIQQKYLKLLVDSLIKDIDTNKIQIIIEKVNKAGVICDEKVFNDIIANLPKKYKSQIEYINYKNNLIKALKFILERENEKDFRNV